MVATRRLALDPGDIHVGWCRDSPTGIKVGEWRPKEACNEIVRLLTHNLVDEIVIEEFILYEKEAKKQAWSKLRTSQLIGAVKWIAYMFRIPLVEQGAAIKTPTRKQMRGRRIRMLPGSTHTQDAQLHYWYRRLRAEKEQEQHGRSFETTGA